LCISWLCFAILITCTEMNNIKLFFMLSKTSRQALGPTQPPIPVSTRGFFSGVKGPGREASHSTPSSVEVIMNGIIPLLPPIHSQRAQGQLNLYLWHNSYSCNTRDQNNRVSYSCFCAELHRKSLLHMGGKGKAPLNNLIISGQITSRPLYPTGERALNRRMGGPQRLSGCCTEEKISDLAGNKPQLPVAQSIVYLVWINDWENPGLLKR
jgi:hypothetical protein